MKKIKRKLRKEIFLFLFFTFGCGKTGVVLGPALPPDTRIVDDTADVGSHFDAVMDRRGIPHIAYLESTGGMFVSRLKYAVLREYDGEWIREYVDNGNGINQKEGLYPVILYDNAERRNIIIYREEETVQAGVFTALKVARGEAGLGNWSTKILRRSGTQTIPTLFADVGYGISAVMFSDRTVGISFIEGMPEGNIVSYNIMYMEINIYDEISLPPEKVKGAIAGISLTGKNSIRDVEDELPSGLPLSIHSLITYEGGKEVIHIFYYNPAGERAEHAFKERGSRNPWKYEAIEWDRVEGEFFTVESIVVEENGNPVTKYVGDIKGIALQDKDRTVLYRNGNPVDPSEWNFYAGGDKIEILKNYSPSDLYSIDYINTLVQNKVKNGKFIRSASDSRGNIYVIYEDIDHRAPVISYRDSKWWQRGIYTGFPNEEGGYSIIVDEFDEPVVTYVNNYYGNLYVLHRFMGRWFGSTAVTFFDSGRSAKLIRSPETRNMGIVVNVSGGNLGLGGVWGTWLLYIPYFGVYR